MTPAARRNKWNENACCFAQIIVLLNSQLTLCWLNQKLCMKRFPWAITSDAILWFNYFSETRGGVFLTGPINKSEHLAMPVCVLQWNTVQALRVLYVRVLVRQDAFCEITSTSEIRLGCMWYLSICRLASQCTTMNGRLFGSGKWPEASHWSEVILHLRWSLLDQLWLTSSVNRKNVAAVRQLNRLLIAC